jgi:hypothetical protein
VPRQSKNVLYVAMTPEALEINNLAAELKAIVPTSIGRVGPLPPFALTARLTSSHPLITLSITARSGLCYEATAMRRLPLQQWGCSSSRFLYSYLTV